ncbi:MAG TPA: DUF2878 domain-containing protein [Pseudomonas sp.]|nr:DUF2878 domain-containing protein [Pseudomonas sp.]
MLKPLANALLFQLGWFACVLSPLNPQWPWLLGVPVLVIGLHLAWIGRGAREARLLLGVLLVGGALDSLLLHLGLFDFGEPRLLIPLWLSLLWLLLATTLGHCLAWAARPWWRASLLGAVSGPLSYYAGAQLAGVGLPLGTGPSLLALAGIWALLLPLLLAWARAS